MAARRVRWTAADLIRSSALAVVASALVLLAISMLDSGPATREAVTVQPLRAAYLGPGALVGALNGGDAPARALARADLDSDGAPDLVVGHAWHGAGIVTIQRGNPDAFAPKRPSVLERMQRGSDPDAFLGSALAVRVPEPVSYVEARDFTGDKHPDVLVAAQRGGLYLLAGDGKGGVAKASSIPLPGPVTTVAAGEFRAADGRSDVAVGVAAPQGPELLLYDGKGEKLAKPMRLSLPGTATAVQFGSLDSDPYADLAVAVGGRVEIVHGWGRKQSPALASRVERVAHVSGVRAISIGYFIRNRDGQNQIAVAFSDGTVRLLIPRNLDTRPLRGKAFRRRAATRLRASRARRVVESQPAWRSSTAPGWRAGRTIAVGATGASAQSLLRTGNLSLLDTDDLLVGRGRHGVELVRPGDSKRSSQKTSRRVAAALTQLNRSVEAPGAVLPLPQTAIGNRGMVVVGDDAVSPTVVILAATTLTVDRTDDPAGAGLTAASACTAAANDCSLRGAVQFANNPANAGSTIVLGANTYTLSINGDRGCVGGGEPAATGNTVGDLEINQSTTITGAGSGSTIIRQIGTGTAANPGDRVMCLNTGFLTNLVYNFSGLTITGGRSTATNIGGGGIIGGELNNSLTLNAVRVSNNQDVPVGTLGGGGIQITGGNLTITNSVIGGTQAPCVHTDASCKSGVDRTNVNMGNLTTGSGGGVTYTPSSPAHTGGTGTLTVTGSTISHNTARGIGGGGFDMLIFAFALPGGIGSGSASVSTSTIDNNSAATGNGGGIVVESLPTTVASSSITSNSATFNGGGIYVGGGGLTLNGTSPSTVTLSGNTAPGGSTISTTFNVTVQGTGVTLGGDIQIAGGGNWTNSAGSVISPTNVTIIGGTFNANDSTTNMGGNFSFGPTPGNEIAFPGTFNSGTGTFNFNGSGAQSISGPNTPTFNNLTVNKPSGTLTLGVNSPVKSNLTVSSGVLDLGAFTANRTAAGGTLTVSNGATLKIGGTNSLPTNYGTYALGATSTVEYAGSGAQTITATNYGNLTSSSTGARTLPSGQTIGVAGAFTPGSNAYTVTGSTVDFNGAGAQTIPALGYNNLTSSSTGARTLASSGTIGVAGTFSPGSNAYTVAGSTVNFNGSGAQTIPAFAYDNLTSSSTGARTLPSGQTVFVAGAFTPGTNAYTVSGSTVNFNGAGAQTIPAFNFDNLTSSSTGARTLASSGTVGVAGTFTPGTNAYTVAGSTVNFNGAGAQTIPAFGYFNLSSSSTGARTLASSGTVGVAGTFTPGTNAYTVGGSTIDFNGTGAQTIPAFGYFSLSSSSTGARTLASSGTVGVAGLFTPGSNAYTVTGSTVDFNGTATQIIPAFGYFNLSSSSAGTRTLVPSGTIGVAGTFSPGSNAYTVAGSTVDFNGSGAQTIPAFSYNNLTSSSTGARTLASSGTIGVAGAFAPGTNAYTVAGSTIDFNGSGGQTIAAFGYDNLTSSSTGARTLASSGTVGVAGTFSPGSNAYTVAGSTVNFNGSGAQTIPAFGYFNLSSSSTGARTLPSGQTVGIAGAFTPGSNAYTVGGSTVDFNGSGAQTIAPFGYNHLTISGNRGGASVTLGAGTIGVAGLFNPSATAVSYVTTGNTVNFNGAATQIIPAFGYFNLSSSSAGTRTLVPSGTIGVAGTFTPGSNAYTVAGSTVSFNGSGAQTIPAFTFDNLIDANTGAAVSLAAAITVNGALTVNANAVLDTTTFVLTVNGTYTNNGQIRHSRSQLLNTTPGPFGFDDGLGVETVRLSGLSAAFGSTTANTAAGGSNPYISCGALPANAVHRFWQVTPANSGTGLARFSFRNDEVAGGLLTDQLAVYRCLSGGSWTQVGTTYTRPAPAGPAPGHSSIEATDVPFNSAGATYVVAQGTPDLTVLKTNNATVATTVGTPWIWTLHVANGGTANASFANGQTLVLDNLPGSSISYGSPSVANVGSGVTGGANISCNIASNDLTCTANGGAVTLGTTGGSFDVVFGATPTSATTFANPRAGGSCSVDPNNNNAEGNEGNNGCSDSVTVGKADTTTSITSDDPDPSDAGQAVSVQFTVASTTSGTPTGNVEVSDGVDTCTGTVATGTCDISLTNEGVRTLTAHYVGDDNYNESTSPGESHTVKHVDDPPTAVDDSPTVSQDSVANVLRVRTNDLNTDGGPFSVESVSDPANGTAAVIDGGDRVSYTPDPGYCNPDPAPDDTFTYTLNGGSTATVSVNVKCADDPPVAVDDSRTVAEDSSATEFRVRQNDLNADGGPFVVESVSDPANGTAAVVDGGERVSYTPDPDYCNRRPAPDDTFTYTLNGGSTATVSVDVSCVDDPPTAVDDSRVVREDSGAHEFRVRDNDLNADGGPFSIQSVSDPANGTATVVGGGARVSYTPDADYCNPDPAPDDTFTYTLNGGSTATVSVNVKCVAG